MNRVLHQAALGSVPASGGHAQGVRLTPAETDAVVAALDTALREDASINLAGVADLVKRFPALDLILIESGGDNLARTSTPDTLTIALSWV